MHNIFILHDTEVCHMYNNDSINGVDGLSYQLNVSM
jgi:hypothetical protein